MSKDKYLRPITTIMWIEVFLIIIGLFLLLKGADWLVSGATILAKKYNMSDLAIGLTIVSFGTSAPELVVNSFASFQNHQDLIYGNVIGSNNFNLFFILGLTGMIAPLAVQSSTVWKEIPLSFLSIIILFVFSNSLFSSGPDVLTRIEGFVLLIMFGFFLYYVYQQLKTSPSSNEISLQKSSTFKTISLIVIGLAGLIVGGQLVVTKAVDLATQLGMSEKMIGLTIVAVGTSLPELATSLVAVFKKNYDIAVGNIVGSNIFNILFILATTSLIRPIPYDIGFNVELYLLLGGTLFLFIAMFTGKKKKLERWEASILFFSYLIYMTYIIEYN